MEKNDFSKAKAISEQYEQLGKCCSIISKINNKKDNDFLFFMHDGGWKVYAYHLEEIGININEIYSYIEKLVQKRKAEIESELIKIE